MKPVELQLRDALIDLVEKLKKFRSEGLSENESNKLVKAVKQKNFNLARNFFKDYVRSVIGELEPKEKGLQAPSTIWPKTFKLLQKILG